MATKITLLKKRKRILGKISDNLDLLIGSVSSKGLKYEAYNLTTKIEGKTKTKHIPIDRVPMVRQMIRRHHVVKKLIKELGEVNWLLLKEGVDLRGHGSL